MTNLIKSLSILLIFFLGGCTKQIAHHSEVDYIESTVKLHNLLEKGDLDGASFFLDSILDAFPEQPEMYFAKGWICDQKSDSRGKYDSFMKARSLYEKRLKDTHRWSDDVNRVCITQILFGMETYQKEVDSLKSSRYDDYCNHPSDSVLLEQFVYE